MSQTLISSASISDHEAVEIAPTGGGSGKPRRKRGRLAGLTVAAALTVASLFAFAAPASAHTWNEVSRKTTCQYYSWGQLCNTRVTYFRHHSGFCNEGPGFGWPGKVAWYSYCYATTGY